MDFFATTYFIPRTANDFRNKEIKSLNIRVLPGNVESYVQKFNNLNGFPLIKKINGKYSVSLWNLGAWFEAENIELVQHAIRKAGVKGDISWIQNFIDNPFMRMVFYHRAAGERSIDYRTGKAKIEFIESLEKWDTIGDYIQGMRNFLGSPETIENAYNFVMNSQFIGRGISLEFTMNTYARQWQKYLKKVSLSPFYNPEEERELKKDFSMIAGKGAELVHKNAPLFGVSKKAKVIPMKL